MLGLGIKGRGRLELGMRDRGRLGLGVGSSDPLPLELVGWGSVGAREARVLFSRERRKRLE